MFVKVFGFELRYQLKSRLFLFGTTIFLLLTFLAVFSPNVQLSGIGGANVNSPTAIVQTHWIMALLAVLIGAAFTNDAALRDGEFRMREIIYSTRITKSAYLLGRFFGAFIVAYLVYLGTTVGFMLGTLMPTLDPELLGAFDLGHYVYAATAVGLPSLFTNLTIVYAVAVWSRDQRIAYAVIVALLVSYQIASGWLGQLDYRTLAALVDPSGSSAMIEATQYWTVFEHNTQLIPFEGLLLYNRLLWFGISIALLAITVARFSFSLSTKKKSNKGVADLEEQPGRVAIPGVFSLSRAAFDSGTAWKQFLARTRFEIRGVLKSVFFWVLVALAGALSLGNFFGSGAFFGTEVYPVTRVLISIMSGSVTLSLLIILVFYGAELVWRDREVRFQEILGSSPAPNWTFVLSKMVAAVLVVFIFLLATALVAIIWQVMHGYTNFEFGVYVVNYFYDYASLFYLAVVLSVVLQILAPNKYLGMLFMVLYIGALLTRPGAGFEDPLYLYGATSGTPYSDMNGYDGELAYASWYTFYWASFATILGVTGYLMWNRGLHEKYMLRLRNAGTNLTSVTKLVGITATVAFAALFSWIFYNTHVLNEYVTSDDQRAFSANYEKAYGHLKEQPIPRTIDVDIEVDLYPELHAFDVRGTYTLQNKTGKAISEVPVGFGFATEITELALEGATLESSDEDYNLHQFRFTQPMQPGETRELTYVGKRYPVGFKHSGNVPGLLVQGGGVFGNGTFVNSGALAPYLGYDAGNALTDRNDRWREGLDPVPRFADLDDESQWGNSYLAQDADWVGFRATVSTSVDQIAIAPGYLIEETVDGDRRSFHYEMDAPMQNFFAVLSARYASKVENWNGVELSVYYHPEHEWNVDRMMTSLKRSIDYFSEHHSPFQYRQMRVLEFPAYATFAQSFPNTVPWSEGIGFIADVTDPEEIDSVFYVGAHEVAHQWWGHQVSSANVQGQTVLVETLAQYSALMVMEEEYGPHMMRRFLKYELDTYLQNRGGEAIEELPLYRVENQQYIHYNKGSVVMYALKDTLGVDAMNRAMQGLIADAAYRYSPYPTSRELIRHIRAQATTEEQQALITDLFEKITLWDLRVDEATVMERDDGKFDVTMNIDATKFYADGEGQQEEAPLNMMIDIGLFTENLDDVFEGEDHVVYFEKHRITSGESTITLTVNKRPSYAGVDPYNKLIDRNSDDNVDSIDEIS
jgi:ABC-type transport system involved in multi-copper enzyme maturation permease subunit